MTLTFTIPPTCWMSANRQVPNHGYRRKLVSEVHAIVTAEHHRARPEPITGPVAAHWEIRYPKGVGWTKGDAANSLPTTKACLDALVDCGLLEDDGPQHITSETFTRGPNLDRPRDHEITLTLTTGVRP